MFIETRRYGGRKKYYLAHSFREGGKVKKIRVYLGTNIKKKALMLILFRMIFPFQRKMF